MSRKYHKNEWKYKRILEILDDYWLTEKDEEYVEVAMYFRKHDGQEQAKHITWLNSKFVKETDCDYLPAYHFDGEKWVDQNGNEYILTTYFTHNENHKKREERKLL